MDKKLENNCRAIVHIANTLNKQINLNSISNNWTGADKFVNKDVGIALNFLVDKGFFMEPRQSQYEINNPTWDVDKYLESIEAEKRLSVVTLKLAGLQIHQLEKVLSDYEWNKTKSWLAIGMSGLALIISALPYIIQLFKT